MRKNLRLVASIEALEGKCLLTGSALGALAHGPGSGQPTTGGGSSAVGGIVQSISLDESSIKAGSEEYITFRETNNSSKAVTLEVGRGHSDLVVSGGLGFSWSSASSKSVLQMEVHDGQVVFETPTDNTATITLQPGDTYTYGSEFIAPVGIAVKTEAFQVDDDLDTNKTAAQTLKVTPAPIHRPVETYRW